MKPYNFDEDFDNYQAIAIDLPQYPKDSLTFIQVTRPEIDGMKYSFQPYQFWIPIYRNQAKRLYLLFARQLFKTTYFCNEIAKTCLVNKGKTACYVAPNEDKLTTFADQKYREQTLQQNPVLRVACSGVPYGLPGRRGKVTYKNGSYSYHVTDESRYGKVEGKSADLVVCDEWQEHDAENIGIVTEAMSKTLGRIIFGGVGGEAGSPQETMWLDTTQAEWHSTYDSTEWHGFEGQGWRKDLQFGSNGLVYGGYMKDVCRGEWIEETPENYYFPGFHLSQLMACHVPLTERDAIDLYKLPPEFSIQWKRKNRPSAIYLAHTHGLWYKAPRRPLNRADVMACMEPYRYMGFWEPHEVLAMKTTFPERVQVFFGADWGSGIAGASETIFSILLKFRGMYENRYSTDRDRFVLIYMERIDPGTIHTFGEATRAINLFNQYRCDFGCGDLGYGEKQVRAIQEGTIDPDTHDDVEGLTAQKFLGTWTRSKVEQIEKTKPYKYDEAGSEEVSHILLDKTYFIQNFVDFIKWKVPHPVDFDNASLTRPKLMIPFRDEALVDRMIKEFTSITRKDVAEDLLTSDPDPRQRARKEFNHPPDSVVSIGHCLVADQHFNSTGGFEGSWSDMRKPGTPGAGSGLFRGTRR